MCSSSSADQNFIRDVHKILAIETCILTALGDPRLPSNRRHAEINRSMLKFCKVLSE
jgi:hypothetical protein